MTFFYYDNPATPYDDAEQSYDFIAPPPPPGPPDLVSQDTNRLWGYLPQFVRDNDANNGYPFLFWLDGICSQQQLIDDLCRDINTGDLCRDINTGDVVNPGWSVVLDVSRCPVYALPWLAQFVGVRFVGATAGDEIAMRNAILGKVNFARGTPAYIANAILPYLQPGAKVNIIERYPDPYSLTIEIIGEVGALTYAELAKKDPIYNQIPTDFPIYADMDSAITEAPIIAAAQAAIPGGLVANIVFLPN